MQSSLKRCKVLVVGGAGYVGSATCAWLLDRGHDVWVLDDLSTGHAELALGHKLVHCRAGDKAVVGSLLANERFDCVMHFAAKSLVAESVEKPELYYENNVIQTRALLETMLSHGVRRFIFSSTCAVFGDPGTEVIHESLPKKPVNPYGHTKLEVERMLDALAQQEGLQAIALRYFNAAGAESGLRVGEWHEPESHLIPRVLKAVLENRPIEVFGTDYSTADGTCVRDYIHVSDLAAAHEAAMLRLMAAPDSGRFEAYNLGSEKGFSVREVINACGKAVGRDVKIVECPRRAGDPPRLVADSALARRVLGFRPVHDINQIVESAWKWENAGVRKAVFLDRDGTINMDPGYISDPKQMSLFPGVGEGLAALKRAGYLLIVVSNQSGVARGLIQQEALGRIHARLDELLSPFDVKIDHYGLCFHHPDDSCECRKPKPKLIIDAARSLRIRLDRSFMVGDKRSDLDAGRAAGCKDVALVRTGYGRETEAKLKSGDAGFVGDSLLAVSDWILRQEIAGR